MVTSYGVVTTLRSWAGSEQISLIQLLCIGRCVILSSLHSAPKVPHTIQASSSIACALLAAVFYGANLWLQGRFVLPVPGPVTMLWLAHLVSLIVLVMIVLWIDDRLKIPLLKNCLTLTSASLMNLGGFSSLAWGAVPSLWFQACFGA